jgi:uncharacterized protein
MIFEYDPEKNAINKAKHRLDFEDFEGFDSDPIVITDERADYGEPRFRAFGRINGIAYMIALVSRDGNLRLLSFRRAHEKEIKRYEK